MLVKMLTQKENASSRLLALLDCASSRATGDHPGYSGAEGLGGDLFRAHDDVKWLIAAAGSGRFLEGSSGHEGHVLKPLSSGHSEAGTPPTAASRSIRGDLAHSRPWKGPLPGSRSESQTIPAHQDWLI